MTDNKLEVGDRLYCIQYGGIQRIVIIDRLTAKMAFAGYDKFYLELEDGRAKVIGAGSFSPSFYYLETEELKSKHKKNMLVRILSSTNYNNFPIEDLEDISKILKIKL